jgi:hypothetical protein
MTESEPNLREDTTAMLAALGIVVTEEGKERARERLAAARADYTPGKRAALRRLCRLPVAEDA